MRRLVSLLAAVAVALALVAVPSVVAPQQHAAEAADCYASCGTITNQSSSDASLYVTYAWGNQWSSYNRLSPGSTSIWRKDADGYYIRSGYKAWRTTPWGWRISSVQYGPRWVKIYDYQHVYVVQKRR